METYCVSCKKNTTNKNSNVRKTKQNRLTLLSNCGICGKKNRLLLKTENSTILILFQMNLKFKINKIIDQFLLTEDKFMPALHLKEPEFTYSLCESFTKHCERIQKFRETCNLKHFYRNDLHKSCFAHDVAYSDSKDLVKRTISDKILKDRAYEISRNCKYDGYQGASADMIYKFFDNKTGSGISVNEQLAEELYKPVIKKFKRTNINARFKHKILAADLPEMELLSSKNKNVKYLLCVIDCFTKYAWVKPLKDKMYSSCNHINYGLIKRDNFAINLCNNG